MNTVKHNCKSTQDAYLLLKYTYGLVYIIAGVDKVTHLNIVTEWTKYISPQTLSLIGNAGLTAVTAMTIVGIIEIILGVGLLYHYTKLAAYATAAWLVLICVNLLGFGLHYFDIIVRDAVLAVAAVALALLAHSHTQQ